MSCTQPSPLAALHSGPPLLCRFFVRGWGKSLKGSKTVVSEPSLGPTRPHLYEASRQKSVSPFAPPHGWQAGTIPFEVCRVGDRQGDRGEQLKVKQFLSCTRTRSRCTRTPRNWQIASNPRSCKPPPTASAPLTASLLFWAQQWVPQDDPRRPATISTRANRKFNALWLQQWQSSAKSPPTPDLVEAPQRQMS